MSVKFIFYLTNALKSIVAIWPLVQVAFGEKVVGEGLMQELVYTFLTTEFEGGERHERRVAKITAIEQKYNK